MFFLHTLKEALIRIMICAAIVFAVWFIASYFDTIIHNSMPNPVYQVWNLFEKI